MTRYLPIPDSAVPLPGLRTVWHVEDRVIALFCIMGQLYAIDDACPHAGGSLASGKIEGRTIQCRAHGLRFDLLTGCLLGSKRFGARAYGIEMRQGKPHLILHTPETTEAPCASSLDSNS